MSVIKHCSLPTLIQVFYAPSLQFPDYVTRAMFNSGDPGSKYYYTGGSFAYATPAYIVDGSDAAAVP